MGCPSLSVQGRGEDEDDDASSDGDVVEHKPKRPAAFDLLGNEDRTLFLRNLLFEADEQDIFRAFECFDGVEWVKFSKDPAATNMKNKGTAFVRFKTSEWATNVRRPIMKLGPL